jgi:ABC-type thiamine transport system ATPase subunit
MKIFWDHAPMVTDNNLKAMRILICGNAGVGKSTLLNKVFDLPLLRYPWLIPSINLKARS